VKTAGAYALPVIQPRASVVN